MTTYDTSFRELTFDQYTEIIKEGTIPGYTSPINNEKSYNALIAQSRAFNIDPRIALAWLWSEGHMGSDPGLVAAVVNNLVGIKWAGQAGATNSGITADTGGTYAAFPDAGPCFAELYRTLNNQYIGPAFRAGDLIRVAEIYTNGPGTGHNKVDQYDYYLTHFPSPDPTSVTPADNRFNTNPARPIIVGGAFMRLWQATPYPLETFGFPMANEEPAMVTDANGTKQRTVQRFERTTMVYQPENAVPWDAVCAFTTEVIV